MSRKHSALLAAAILLLVSILGGCMGGIDPTPTSSTTPSDVLSAGVGKPEPIDQVYQGCPGSGDGGDPVLNTLKNRIDEAQWQPTTVASLLSLTWPRGVEEQPHSRWSQADAAAIAQHEGTPLQVEGYIVLIRKEGPESTNCHSVVELDYHMWLTDDPGKDRTQSIVVEATPRMRSYHSAWTQATLLKLVQNKTKVRISGWLMMDPEHPDQVGATRGSIWEVHPIMQIETQSGGGWKPLDNGTSGVSSQQQTAAQTMPPVTPHVLATMPPIGNTQVQHNEVVQIQSVFANGAGSNEPDEYVEIKNTGSNPVDITDWVLEDNTGKVRYKWENYTMTPGQTIRVYTNQVHQEWGGFSIGSKQAIWGNSGDVAALYDADKQLVSRYAYGNQK